MARFPGSGFYYRPGAAARDVVFAAEDALGARAAGSEIVADAEEECGTSDIGPADYSDRGIALAEVHLDSAPGKLKAERPSVKDIFHSHQAVHSEAVGVACKNY